MQTGTNINKKKKLILIATQAVGTRENDFLIKAAENSDIACLVFTLDKMNFFEVKELRGFEILVDNNNARSSGFNKLLNGEDNEFRMSRKYIATNPETWENDIDNLINL